MLPQSREAIDVASEQLEQIESTIHKLEQICEQAPRSEETVLALVFGLLKARAAIEAAISDATERAEHAAWIDGQIFGGAA